MTESDRVPGPYPYYGANGQQGTINEYIFDERLVLLAEDGGHFDDPARGVAYRIEGKTWVNNHAHVLRPGPEIEWAYLSRVLENYDLANFVAGTTRAKLTKTNAARIPIPVPPLGEQRRIAGILDRADDLHHQRQNTVTMLSALARAMFIEMFGDPTFNAKRYSKRALGSLGIVSTGGTPPSGMDGQFGGRVPFVTPGDLEADREPKRTLTEAGAARVGTTRKGSTLVCCIGTIGKMGMARERSAFNQQINAVEWSSSVNPHYGFYALLLLKQEIVRLGASTTVSIVKKSTFSRIEIPVPPLHLQELFAHRLEKVDSLRAKCKAHLLGMSSLFDSLKYKAFSEGGVRIASTGTRG